MANGIKLRRGLKTALATTIADGEFVFCSDTGELGFKKGVSEVYVDLEKITTVDDLQTNVDKLQAKEVSLLPGQFKVSINKFYNFSLNPESKPLNKGGFRIPIAKVNPLYIGNEFALHQIFDFSNVNIKAYSFGSYNNLLMANYTIYHMTISTQSDGSGGLVLNYDSFNSDSDFRLKVLDDGYGNFSIWIEADVFRSDEPINKVRIDFNIDCVSEVGKDQNNTTYNVFLPPLGLEVTPYNGAV